MEKESPMTQMDHAKLIAAIEYIKQIYGPDVQNENHIGYHVALTRIARIMVDYASLLCSEKDKEIEALRKEYRWSLNEVIRLYKDERAKLAEADEVIESISKNWALHQDKQKSELELKDKRIEELERGGWISVEQRLPEKGYWTLIYSWRGVMVASFWESHWCLFQYSEPGISIELEDVSHWQPLPKPPVSLLNSLDTEKKDTTT